MQRNDSLTPRPSSEPVGTLPPTAAFAPLPSLRPSLRPVPSDGSEWHEVDLDFDDSGSIERSLRPLSRAPLYVIDSKTFAHATKQQSFIDDSLMPSPVMSKPTMPAAVVFSHPPSALPKDERSFLDGIDDAEGFSLGDLPNDEQMYMGSPVTDEQIQEQLPLHQPLHQEMPNMMPNMMPSMRPANDEGQHADHASRWPEQQDEQQSDEEEDMPHAAQASGHGDDGDMFGEARPVPPMWLFAALIAGGVMMGFFLGIMHEDKKTDPANLTANAAQNDATHSAAQNAAQNAARDAAQAEANDVIAQASNGASNTGNTASSIPAVVPAVIPAVIPAVAPVAAPVVVPAAPVAAATTAKANTVAKADTKTGTKVASVEKNAKNDEKTQKLAKATKLPASFSLEHGILKMPLEGGRVVKKTALNNPGRAVIELAGVPARAGAVYEINQKNVKRIEIGASDGKTMRIVIEHMQSKLPHDVGVQKKPKALWISW